ncbi:MAG: T9SS type A sorting domain-containing protein, partial [Schleiferiaceae bacterium]
VANWTATIISAGGGGMQVQFDGTSSTGGNSFQWNFGDGNINTTSNYPLHTYATPSTAYVVSLTVYNACGDSDTKTGVLGENLGVEDMDLGQWTIFPNPVRTQLTLEHTAGVKGMITLVDGLGRTVVEMPGNGQATQQIDVTDLSAGSYVLRIVSDGGFYQQRIQIVK